METVTLPSHASADRASELVQSCEHIAREADLRVIDATGVTRWGPLGVAMLGSALARRQLAGLAHLEFRPPSDDRCRKFFAEVGLLEHLAETASPDRSSSTLKLRQMSDLEPLYTRGVADLLTSQVAGTSDEVSHLIELCLNELLQNVFEHAYPEAQPARKTVGAFVHCRWYAREGNVRIAVVDGGIGIPAALRVASHRGNIQFRDLQRMSDSALVIDAVTKEGLSSREGPRAGGLGLKTLHEIATSRGGRLVVVSHQITVGFRRGSRSARKSPHFRGTAVEVDFRPV